MKLILLLLLFLLAGTLEAKPNFRQNQKHCKAAQLSASWRGLPQPLHRYQNQWQGNNTPLFYKIGKSIKKIR